MNNLTRNFLSLSLLACLGCNTHLKDPHPIFQNLYCSPVGRIRKETRIHHLPPIITQEHTEVLEQSARKLNDLHETEQPPLMSYYKAHLCKCNCRYLHRLCSRSVSQPTTKSEEQVGIVQRRVNAAVAVACWLVV